MEKLNILVKSLTVTSISKTCFERGTSWIKDRLNGFGRNNGYPLEFSNAEKIELARFLRDKAQEMTDIAADLEISAQTD